MVSVGDIYFDQFKRGLDSRSKTIFAGQVAVFAFGTWVLQRQLSGTKPDLIVLEHFNPTSFAALAIAFIACWGLYFLALSQFERTIDQAIRNMKRELPLNDKQEYSIKENLNLRVKYIPFVINSVTFLAIVFL
jgi:hypothetical protein